MANQTTITDTNLLGRLYGWRLFAARGVWILIAALAIIIFFLTIPLTYAGRLEQAYTLFPEALPQLGLTPGFYAAYFSVVQIIHVIISAALGIFIVIRRSDEPVALIVASVLVVSSAQNITGYNTLLRDMPDIKPLVVLVYAMSFFSLMAMVFLFPDGKFYPKWTRWLLLAAIPLTLLDGYANLGRSVTGSQSGTPFVIGIGLLSFIGLYFQRQRYRRVLTPPQRQQVKWILFGMALAFIPVTIFNMVDPIITPWLIENPTIRVLYRFAIQLFVFYIPYTTFSITIAFAIFRYRLWDIDYAINRSIGYAIVTLMLVVVFLILFLILQSVILNPVALTLLAVGAGLVFNPVRKRVQGVIDRRLYGLRFPIDRAKDYGRAAQPAAHSIALPGSLTGQTFAGYQLTDQVGRGGMGEVYRGEVNGKTVAIKILPGMADDDTRTRFTREAEILQRLDHPNVVKFYEHGEANGVRFMIMDYLDGVPLNDFLQSGEPMNLATVRKILTDVASALDYIHARGIVHRDLKPGNIMLRLNPDKTVAGAILMDFGVAKSQTTSITGVETMGTIDYMAPEQIQSSGTVDQRADIYALGVMLFEMVTGVRPFVGNVGQVLFAHLRQPAPDPHNYVPGLPSQVAIPILRALAKQPDDRYGSAGDLATAIAA